MLNRKLVPYFLVFTFHFLLAPSPALSQPRPVLKIGVTLHPYYSWASNVVGTLPGYEVRALLPGDIDAGDYQPRPQDITRLADLDVVIVNGIGHDDFIFSMLKASGNRRATIIRVNAETPMIRASRGTGVNAHTFISFSNAIQQTYAIQRALSRLRPQDAAALQQNAAEYARRLRTIKAKAATQLADATITRVVTVHDGYGYLLQEFGLDVGGVVQPSHGLTPSAGELRDMVALLRRDKIRVVFSEAAFPEPLLKVLRDEAGVTVHVISHIASGPFTADRFEREMQANVETMIRALKNSTTDDVRNHLLEISGLTLRPAREALLSDVSLSVSRGALHAIVGPNGAGKTTLLSAILGLVPFEGRIVAHWTGRGRIAYVPQHFHVDRTLPLTVADFLALTRQRRPVCLGIAAATRQRISRLLERVGLPGFGDRPLSVLSGGELRRVLLANALDPLPELLILDEPLAGLDEASARWLDETLVSLKGEITVLMVSHDADQVRRLADSVTVLAGLKAGTTNHPNPTNPTNSP